MPPIEKKYETLPALVRKPHLKKTIVSGAPRGKSLDATGKAVLHEI